MIIYKVTNKIDGKIYIGQTTQPLHRRWQDHCRGDKQRDSYLHRAIAKHGISNFVIEQIDSADSLDVLNVKEQTYIKALNTLAPNGYNLQPGGNNRRAHEDTRAKISQSLKGRPIANRWAGGRSGPHTEETKEKISQTLKGRPIKNRMNGAPKGRPVSQERRDRISATLKGRPNTALYKAVICIETGKVYASINAAAKDLNLNRVTISSLLKTSKVSRNGLSFKYLNPYLNKESL